MSKAYSSWGIAAVVLYAVSFCFPPCGIFLGTIMLNKPTMVTIEVNKVLKSGTVYELPAWINDCSRGDE